MLLRSPLTTFSSAFAPTDGLDCRCGASIAHQRRNPTSRPPGSVPLRRMCRRVPRDNGHKARVTACSSPCHYCRVPSRTRPRVPQTLALSANVGNRDKSRPVRRRRASSAFSLNARVLTLAKVGVAAGVVTCDRLPRWALRVASSPRKSPRDASPSAESPRVDA